MSVDVSEGHEAMDYKEHTRTYGGFLRGVKWGTAFVLVILGMTAYLSMGMIGPLIAAVVVTLGIAILF